MSGGMGGQSRHGGGRENHQIWGCWSAGGGRRVPRLSPRFIRGATPVRVFLVDDVGAFRTLMRFTLEEDPRIQVVGEAADGRAGVSGVEELKPDVVLLDLAMPVLDGFEAIPLMLERSPGTSIVALSGFTAERMAQLCIASGAHAYIEKGEDAEAIREAVLEAAVAA
jgi:DNA-binding NarL/FixJ family response regulator